MTTPEPAVSPAPDTEALRQQALKDAKSADAERVDAIRDGTLDDAANAVFEALGGYPGPEIVTFGQALEAVRKQRADLARARAERDEATSHVQELRDFMSMGDASDAAMVILQAQTLIRVGKDAEQHRDALSRILRGMARRASEQRQKLRTLFRVIDRQDQELATASSVLAAVLKDDYFACWPGGTVEGAREAASEIKQLRRELAEARVSGARPIPDDAAVREALAVWIAAKAAEYSEISRSLFNDGKRTKAKWYGSTAGSLRADASNIRSGRTSLADLGATPTTGPAPAAADPVAAALHLHREFRIYGECGHRHTEEGNGVISVENVGLTCAEGYEYSICRECCTSGSDYQTEECATNHEGERACWPCRTHDVLSAAPQPPTEKTGKWSEGDVAADRTGFVHVRYAQGWRTYPRTTGTQYGDDVMEAHLGPLVRLDAVPPGTSDVGALPRGFARESKCTVAGCTDSRWRDFDVCQFHVPLKGNIEVRRPAAREDTAPPVWTRHEVDVRIDAMGWGTATCRSGCGVIAQGLAHTVDPVVDAHRADTLRPTGPLTPIQPEEA